MPTNNPKLQNISFYILFAVLGLVVAFMFLPFFKLIALGGILAVLFHPLKLRLLKDVKNNTVASIITLVVAILIIAIPIYLIGQLIFNELFSLYVRASHSSFSEHQQQILSFFPPQFQETVKNIFSDASQKLAGFAGTAFQSITSLATNIAGFIVDIIITVFVLYYLLKDGDKLIEFFERVFPLPKQSEEALAAKLELAVKGVVQGSFTVALIQATVSTIGFLVFGVPQPFLWGVLTLLAALVPTVGTALSLVPAVLFLFFSGHTGAGIGMAIWAWASIQGIDNFISPKLIGHKTHLHPLVTLLSILGGISLFGYLGFLIGPILMAIFMALTEIYSANIKKSV